MSQICRLPTLVFPVLLLGATGLAGCTGMNDFESTCRAEGHEPGTAAYTRCLDEAYERNTLIGNRYRSGGP